MKFHLNHSPAKFDFEISHKDPLFLIGSCFAENMGEKLNDLRFNFLSNPCGILFNPKSICDCLTRLTEEHVFEEKYLLEREDELFSYLHHSSFHASDRFELIEKIQLADKNAFEQLRKSKVLIVSFGTAFAYRHKQLKTVVANCHKQPQETFEKILLQPESIVEEYSLLLTKLKKLQPGLKIIFTVSPVKYLKEGLEANSLSKAILLLAVHMLVRENQDCFYFPAYELLNDDLRDYRFYKEDLAHPNSSAIDYIWEKFSSAAFSVQCLELSREIAKLNAALHHRRMGNSPSGQQKLLSFIDEQKQKILKLEPGIDL